MNTGGEWKWNREILLENIIASAARSLRYRVIVCSVISEGVMNALSRRDESADRVSVLGSGVIAPTGDYQRRGGVQCNLRLRTWLVRMLSVKERQCVPAEHGHGHGASFYRFGSGDYPNWGESFVCACTLQSKYFPFRFAIHAK